MIRSNSGHGFSDDGSVSSLSNGSDSAPARRERIPRTLQGVFLTSNRGKEVHAPPPEQVANKTFFKNWLKGAFPWSRRNAAKRNAAARQQQQQQQYRDNNTITTRAETILEGNRHLKNAVRKDDIPVATILAATVPTKTKVKKPAPLPISPQAYLDAMIRKRGYLTRRYKTLKTGYYNQPTELQKASYHIHLIGLARSEDAQGFRAVMQAGISPNPCNQHGESLVHTICRKGSHELLKIMLECGTTVQVSDDYGRTPLHDACWGAKPSFATVKLLLEQDIRLLHLTDARDAVPLSYVHKEDWKAWIDFIDEHKDHFWPTRHVSVEGEQEDPPLALVEPNSRPLPDPEHALPPNYATLVACGKMSPQEAAIMMQPEDDEEEAEEDSDDDDDEESESGSEEEEEESGSEYDSDDEDSDYDSDDDEEMARLMSQLPMMKGGGRAMMAAQ